MYSVLFIDLQAVPGPGKYELYSQFDKRPQPVNPEGLDVEHPPFMSQAKVSQHMWEKYKRKWSFN